MTLPEAMNLAVAHHQAGRLAEAESVYRRVLLQQKDNADALNLLGVLCYQRGKNDEATQLINRAIAISPRTAQFFFNLALVKVAQRRWDEAVTYCQRTLQFNPQFTAVFPTLGTALYCAGRFDEAITILEKAVALEPANAITRTHLGNAYYGRGGMLPEAATAYFQAIALDPAFLDAYANLANALNDQGISEQAVEWCRRALALNPDYVEARNTLGIALRTVGRLAEAKAAFERVLELQPDHAAAHWNLALALLIEGDLPRGFAEYEWRWKLPQHALRRPSRQPLWDGADLSGKQFLLYTEQGLSEAIQCSRLIPKVAERGGRVILSCQPELMELLQNIPGVAQVVSSKQPPPEHDFQQSILSLPALFKLSLDSIPRDVPYLRADASVAEHWKSRLAGDTRRKIGLVWGDAEGSHPDRTVPLDLSCLAPLTNVEGVHWISLHKGDSARTLRAGPLQISDWTHELSNFAQTAALIDNLDLVIAVDSPIAHLAAAMGKPVWVFLPTVPNWQWMRERSDSPWYPTMRLFRQKHANDWTDPIARVVEALAHL